MKIMTGQLSPIITRVLHGEHEIKIKMRIGRDILYNRRDFIYGIFIVICFDAFADYIGAAEIFFSGGLRDHNRIGFV